VESAREGDLEPIALDVFGDRDTRERAAEWYPIGRHGSLAFDSEALLQRLSELAKHGDVAGWVAGSGFEACPELLADGAKLLPLLGNTPALVARIRSPDWFYARLAALGITHAPVATVLPEEDTGDWLFKDARSCGGWHVRPAAQAPARHGPGGYFQRRVAGVPMAALLLADGSDWRLVGVTRQILRGAGRRPYTYLGGIGPVALDGSAAERLRRMIDRLVREFGLLGLNGVDIVLDEGEPVLIELNPRPTASMALLSDAVRGGLLRAHVEVCQGGRLPQQRLALGAESVLGHEVVFATRDAVIGEALSNRLAERHWCRDRPWPGAHVMVRDPVCSIVATGPTEDAVRVQLSARRREIEELLESAND